MSYFKLLFSLIIICFSLQAKSEVKIALFSLLNKSTGKIFSPWVKYPEEQRYHAAIEINGYWFQMNPYVGVTRSNSLPEIIKGNYLAYKDQFNLQVEVFVNSSLKLRNINVFSYKRVSFDLLGAWEDKNTSHCAKFVAKIAGIKPVRSKSGSGGLNISPDDLHDILTLQNWVKHIYKF